jgi:hypothetical protein
MITEIVLFRLPKDMSRKEAMDKYRATIPIWQGKPGLIRKTFLYDEASQRGGAVYLWNNIESVKEAHGRVFQERIRSWWGADPEFQFLKRQSCLITRPIR